MNKLNLDWGAASTQRVNDFNFLGEFLPKTYESVGFYKYKIKKYHDQRMEKRDFAVRDLVLLFNLRLRLFPGKLKSKCSGPFLIKQVFSHGAVEFENSEGTRFKVNG